MLCATLFSFEVCILMLGLSFSTPQAFLNTVVILMVQCNYYIYASQWKRESPNHQLKRPLETIDEPSKLVISHQKVLKNLYY